MEFETNWREEKRSAYLYSIMATHENNFLHRKLFNDLASSAETQASMWEKRIKQNNKNAILVFHPDFKTKVVATLIKWFGTNRVHTMLSAMKIRGMAIFRDYHTEHKHISLSTTSNLRAAVFGINDGLVSNMSFILGIAGANVDQHFIIIGGIACLLAGACSMGAGEYVSVRSQREMYQYQISLEEEELKEYPEEETEELALIYEARGIPKEDAKKLATMMIQNPKTALNTLAREELGLNPDDLVSPIGAMIASFLAFSLGAAIPLLPFFFFSYPLGLYTSIAATGITLFIIGASLSLFTNRHPVLLGCQMLSVGTIAGAITYFIGWCLGVKV